MKTNEQSFEYSVREEGAGEVARCSTWGAAQDVRGPRSYSKRYIIQLDDEGRDCRLWDIQYSGVCILSDDEADSVEVDRECGRTWDYR